METLIQLMQSIEAIERFNNADIGDVDGNDDRLKCYMYCFLHEFEHFDFSNELEDVDELLTIEESDILIKMLDKCDDLESQNSKMDACDLAFEFEKCWKEADPEVNLFSIVAF